MTADDEKPEPPALRPIDEQRAREKARLGKALRANLRRRKETHTDRAPREVTDAPDAGASGQPIGQAGDPLR